MSYQSLLRHQIVESDIKKKEKKVKFTLTYVEYSLMVKKIKGICEANCKVYT